MKSRIGCLYFKRNGGSRQNPFGEWVLASDKPENLVLGAAAKDDGTRTRLAARDESPPLRAADVFRLSLASVTQVKQWLAQIRADDCLPVRQNKSISVSRKCIRQTNDFSDKGTKFAGATPPE